MRQRLNRLVNRFKKWMHNTTVLDKTIWLFPAIPTVALIIVLLTVVLDTAPATANDYAPMEKQAMAIQQNRDMLFKTDCSVSISNEVATVTMYSKECNLITEYDLNFNIISSKKVDNYITWYSTLGLCAAVAFCAYFMLVFVTVFLVCAIQDYLPKKWHVTLSNR